MKLGMTITQTDPERVFNALRLAHYALEEEATRCVSSSRAEESKLTKSKIQLLMSSARRRKFSTPVVNSLPAAPD